MVARRAEEAPKHTDGLGLGIQALQDGIPSGSVPSGVLGESPEPQTPNPKPGTLNPKPGTLNPKP